MIIIRNKIELGSFLQLQRENGLTIGFVPTMGALHEGHISLLMEAKKQVDFTVCSIFVNPNQFNDKSDLARYPRTPEKDALMLEKAGCDVLFLPDVEEIYPEEDKRVFDFGKLDKVLDGAHRPGHFNGVAQVVSRLFDIVQPDKAFFGLKDYQQLLIIKALTKQLNLKVIIVPCAILREKDGLAMSSRNMLLNPAEREAAAIIPQLLSDAKSLLKAGKNMQEVKGLLESKLSKNQIYKLDYLELCNASDLNSINSLNKSGESIILIACFVGKIRLIDNLVIN